MPKSMETDCIGRYVFNYHTLAPTVALAEHIYHTLAPTVALTEHIYIISC